MTEKPVIAATAPVAVELTEGKPVFWCSCGRSENQPFCDGKHKGSAFAPTKYVPEKSGRHFLCACKQTDNQPLCDGSHQALK